jgi:hypothetical protein
MRAVAVAAPVAERLARSPAESWRVVGSGARTAYIESNGFVVALTGPGVPWMPNGIALDQQPMRWPAVGSYVRSGTGVLYLGDRQVYWSAAQTPIWEPAPTPARGRRDVAAIRARGQAVLRACGVRPAGDAAALTATLAGCGLHVTDDPDGRRGVDELLGAVGDGDPSRARAAAIALLGRGPGLTPEGDDLLCGAAATVARYGTAGGLGAPERDRWLAAICPPDVRHRSSYLSATLLQLAAAGNVAQPADGVLDLDARDWRTSLRDLLAVGSSTGRAYALSIGAAAWLLGGRAGDA